MLGECFVTAIRPLLLMSGLMFMEREEKDRVGSGRKAFAIKLQKNFEVRIQSFSWTKEVAFILGLVSIMSPDWVSQEEDIPQVAEMDKPDRR